MSFSRAGACLLALALVPACTDNLGEGDQFGTVIVRVSVDDAGEEVLGSSVNLSISAGGRYAAFDSDARDLVSGDGNGVRDVFVKDRMTGEVEIVSVSNSATFPPFFESSNPSISGDGSLVAFQSGEILAAGGFASGKTHVYVRDRAAQTTLRVVDPAAVVDEDMIFPAISPNGRYVAFLSSSTTVPTPAAYTNPSAVLQVFVSDRSTNPPAVRLVSRTAADANIGGNGACLNLSVSDNGEVAFQTSATDLHAADADTVVDIYVGSASGAPVELNSRVGSTGAKGTATSSFPNLTPDGRFLAYSTKSANITGTPTQMVVVRDRQALPEPSTVIASLDAAGAPAGPSTGPVLSADGRYIAFNTIAATLVGGGAPGTIRDQVVWKDLQGGFVHVSRTPAGEKADSFCFRVAISGDGRWVGWQSTASNLVASDTNGSDDVFIWGPTR